MLKAYWIQTTFKRRSNVFTFFQLEIKLKTTSKPSTNTKITVTSNSDTTVYLLAVDRSVNLLKTGNNIDKSRLREELQQSNTFQNSNSFDEERSKFIKDSNMFVIWSSFNGNITCIDPRGGEESSYNTFESPNLEETEDIVFESSDLTRKDFRETWIFQTIEMQNENEIELEAKVPDSITTWDVTGFSLSSKNGLSFAEPKKLLVKQDFFIQLHLPYSIRVGEILKVEATLFSYFEKQKEGQPLNVKVTLFSEVEIKTPVTKKSSEEEMEDELFGDDSTSSTSGLLNTEFEFFEAKKTQGICSYQASEIDNMNKLSSKVVKVDKNSGSQVHFYIVSKKSGPITIKMRAEVIKKGKTLVLDEVEQVLRVQHEGLTKYNNYATLIKVDGESYNYKLGSYFETPFPNSIRNHLTVVGNLMGPAIVSTENLM